MPEVQERVLGQTKEEIKKQKRREYGRWWRARHPESIRQYGIKKRIYDRAYRAKNHQKILDRVKARYVNKRDEILVREQQYRAKTRRAAIDAYGGPICRCIHPKSPGGICGEATLEFLAVDHINGGGKQHRRETKMSGRSFYMWLKRHGYPPGFQILCHNCNLAKGFYGSCPHSIKEPSASVSDRG